MLALRLFRGNRIILRRAPFFPLVIEAHARRRLDLVRLILLERLEDDERRHRRGHAIAAPESNELSLLLRGLSGMVRNVVCRPCGREQASFMRFRRSLFVLRELLDAYATASRRLDVQFIREEKILGSHCALDLVETRTAVIDERIDGLQQRCATVERPRRFDHVAEDHELVTPLPGQAFEQVAVCGNPSQAGH